MLFLWTDICEACLSLLLCLPPVSLGAVPQIYYLCCKVICGIGPQRERNESSRHIWSTVKLRRPQNPVRASPPARATPF